MRNFKIVSGLFVAIMLSSNIAMAEGKKLAEKLSLSTMTISAEVKGCEADTKEFCAGLIPNSKQAFMCLMAYEEKLSAACKLGFVEAAMSIKMGMAALDYSIKACEADADKHCLDVTPGKGEIVSCLKKNEASVSKPCIAALKETGFWTMNAK